MVEVWLWDIVIGILLIVLIVMHYQSGSILKNGSADMDDRLDVIEDSLKVVGAVLQQIPEMVPRFELQNNPLSQLLEFFQQIRSERQPSLNAEQLRDDNGRFSNGTEEENN